MISVTIGTKPNIKDLPKVDFFAPPSTAKKTATTKKTNSGSDSGSKKASTPKYTDEDLISKYITSIYAGYTPSHIEYTEKPANELSGGIAAWLRPTFDKAISDRKALTDNYRAELDADAISRGMGASTYISAVKGRQMSEEAKDIASYETSYSSQLAKYLSEAVEKERDRSFEVKVQNAELDHAAYMNAYSTALSLFQAYKKKNPGNVVTKLSSPSKNFSTLDNCESYVSGLTESARKALFDGTDASSLQTRNQMISGIGATNFLYLQERYPGK